MRAPIPTGLLSWRTAIEAGITAVVTAGLALVVFGPIWSGMDKPLGSGDMYATYMNAEAYGGFGYSVTTQAGYPLGMNLNYAPNLDHTQNAFAKLVDILSGSPFLGINLLLFLSFPLTAVLAYLLLRMVSGGGPLAIALAAAFSLIPYHFGRGLGHTYLATMYSGVTALILAFAIGLGVVPWLRSGLRRSHQVLGWWLIAALAVITAWSGLYYAAFGLILMAAAWIWRIAQRDRWSDLAISGLLPISLGVLALIGFLPGLLATWQAPPSEPLAERMPIESVTFAGNLAMAVIPAPISQLPGMWRYNEAVYEAIGAAPVLENTALTNFGTWITSLCLLVFLVGLVVLNRRDRLRRTPLTFITYLTVVTILFFVPWGLNYLVAGTVTAQVRAWNRLLPLLLLLFITGAMTVLARTRLGRLSAPSVVVALLVVAMVLVEQVIPFRAAYAAGSAAGTKAAASAQEYAAQVNGVIPGDCGVLQLPYVIYPEQGTIEKLNDYEHFLQALVNQGKDWSYGAVKGTRATTPLENLGNRLSRAQVQTLLSQGFCAVHVDLRGFTPTAQTWVTNNMTQQFGEPIATGDGGRWLMFRLVD